MNIIFSHYQKPFIQSGDKDNYVRQHLNNWLTSQMSDLGYDNIYIYNMELCNDRIINHNPNKDLFILFNASMNENPEDILVFDTSQQLFGYNNNYNIFYPLYDYHNFFIENSGRTLAEYDKDNNTLYILFDIFGSTAIYDKSVAICKDILSNFLNHIQDFAFLRFSWLNADNKDSIRDNFVNMLTSQRIAKMENNKRSIEEAEQRIRQYSNDIKTYYDKVLRLRKEVNLNDESIKDSFTAISKELDILAAHPKIKDICLKDNYFIIVTHPLTIHASNGRKYYGGEFTIKMNMGNTEVHFSSTEKHHSYWTSFDPHPHVNGRDGMACLGNISTTIAELCSQEQLYALAMICIDFCESANVDDPAGANVKNWPLLDDAGNIVPEDERNDRYFQCACCENRVEDDNEIFKMAIDTWREGYRLHYNDPDRVCRNCFDNYAKWSDDYDLYYDARLGEL